MSTENRIIDLEIKVSRHDDLLDVLNQTIYRQQKKIDELEALCSALARRIREMVQTAQSDNGGNLAHEKPPHY